MNHSSSLCISINIGNKVKLFRQLWPEATPDQEGAETKSIPGLECAESRENDCVTTPRSSDTKLPGVVITAAALILP